VLTIPSGGMARKLYGIGGGENVFRPATNDSKAKIIDRSDRRWPDVNSRYFTTRVEIERRAFDKTAIVYSDNRTFSVSNVRETNGVIDKNG